MFLLNSDSTMSFAGSVYHKTCRNNACGAVFYPGFSLIGGKIHPNEDRHFQKYWISTTRTVFCMDLLKKASAEMVETFVSIPTKFRTQLVISHQIGIECFLF